MTNWICKTSRTYDATLWRVRVTTVAVEKQQILVMYLFLLSYKHNNIDLVYLFDSILQGDQKVSVHLSIVL